MFSPLTAWAATNFLVAAERAIFRRSYLFVVFAHPRLHHAFQSAVPGASAPYSYAEIFFVDRQLKIADGAWWRSRWASGPVLSTAAAAIRQGQSARHGLHLRAMIPRRPSGSRQCIVQIPGRLGAER